MDGGDRLALLDVGLVAGRRIFKQSKTLAIVAIREAPELEARLAAARERRRRWKVEALEPFVILDETARRPFRRDHYRHLFADVRARAVAGVAAPHVGEPFLWILEPCPSLADFRDQDLRDTAVTWMALGGATIPEICAVTGHSLQSATTILKHYLARHPELADAAIGKMVAWFNSEATPAP